MCFTLLLGPACRSARPDVPAAPAQVQAPAQADFLSISRSGPDSASRWTEVKLSPGGFRTDLFAKASSPGEGAEPIEVHLTLIRLSGPGEYRLGFGWDRGQSRATIRTGAGEQCMTPGSDAGVVEITAAPAEGQMSPGQRLEGRFTIRCYPEAKPTSGQEARVFTGTFAVTAGADTPN